MPTQSNYQFTSSGLGAIDATSLGEIGEDFLGPEGTGPSAAYKAARRFCLLGRRAFEREPGMGWTKMGSRRTRALLLAASVPLTLMVAVAGGPVKAADSAGALVQLASIPMSTGADDVAVDPVAQRVYVTEPNTGYLDVFNENTLAEIAQIPVGLNASWVTVDASTSRAYVGYDTTRIDYITVVDTSSETVINRISTSTPVSPIAVDDSTGRLYVANIMAGIVSVIDASTDQVVHTIYTLNSPGWVAVNPATNELFVENNDSLVILDASTYQQIATVSYDTAGPANYLSVDPKTNRVFIPAGTNTAPGNLVTVDSNQAAVLATTSLGETFPRQAVFDSGHDWVYVANWTSSSLSIIDANTYQVVGDQPVPDALALALDPTLGRLFVLGDGSGAATLYEYDTNEVITSTGLAASPNPTTYGQSVQLSATVMPTDGGGSVEFMANGSPIPGCSAVPLTSPSNDTATSTCSTDTLDVGSNDIQAVYSGDSRFESSTARLSQEVNISPTSTGLASDSNPSSYGQTVHLAATVNPTDGVGSVEFLADGSPIPGCAAVPLTSPSNDTATSTCSTDTLALGSHDVQAVYSGDSRYESSTGQLSQQVNIAQTSTILASEANPSVYGETIHFTATVTPTDGGGSVTFFDNGTAISGCTQLALSTSSSSPTATATCQTGSFTPGSHSIDAEYSGDSDYSRSSATLTQTVTRAPTELSAQPAALSINAAAAQTMTISATLIDAETGTPLAGEPVTMTAGGATLCLAFTDGNGVGSCSLGPLQTLRVLANNGYTASYAGSFLYMPSSAQASVRKP